MADDELPDEVPEADALEQRQEVEPTTDDEGAPVTGGPHVDDDFEVPEADAIDQAREVGIDDEPDPEHA